MIDAYPSLHHASEGVDQGSSQRAAQDSSGTTLLPVATFLRLNYTNTSQKTKGDGKPAATPTKTTPKKAAPAKKEEAKANTPKKPKPAVTYTRLARDPKAALPVDVAYQGDIAESKAVKASFTHVLKLDAGAPFTLLDSVSLPTSRCARIC